MYGSQYPNLKPIPRQELKVANSERPEMTVDLTVDIEEGARFIRIDQSERPREPSLSPSPLEAFAARPAAKVVWSKMIGRLEGSEARATLTALRIEDAAATPSVMRGLRIDLARAHTGQAECDWKYLAWKIMCERANAAVYVEEERLEEVRNGVGRGAAQLRPMEFISASTSGLIACGYQFSHSSPYELAALFTRGIAELKESSR